MQSDAFVLGVCGSPGVTLMRSGLDSWHVSAPASASGHPGHPTAPVEPGPSLGLGPGPPSSAPSSSFLPNTSTVLLQALPDPPFLPASPVPASRVQKALASISSASAAGAFSYNKFVAIGLFRLLELSGAKEPSALEKLVKAVGVKPEAVNRDLLMYKVSCRQAG